MAKNCLHDSARFVVAFCILFAAMGAHAGDSWFTLHEKGWHWYDDPKKQVKDESSSESDDDSGMDEMTAVQAAVRRAMNRAVLHPTETNVKNYIILQEKMTDRAQKFSSVWQAVQLQHPELDYSISHPVNNLARQIMHDGNRAKEDAAIRLLAQNSGLFFFYRSSCPYCRAFAPTVKQFSETHGVKVVAITTDGISLPEFPASRTDQGQAAKLHVTAEPALFAVNPRTHKAIPVSFGLMSLTDLRARILQIATRFDGDVP